MPRKRREVPWLDWHENGVAYVFWYDPASGRTKRISLDTRDPVEAQRKYGEFLIGGPPRPKLHGLGVRAASEDYLREHVEAKDDKGRPLVSDDERQKTIVGHLVAYFGDTDITSIGPIESRGYREARRTGRIGGGKKRRVKIDEIGREDRSALMATDATIRRELNCLTAIFNHEVKWKRLPNTARCTVELPGEERNRDVEWFTKEQVRMLLEASTGDLHDFIKIAYYTAARRNSVERLNKFQVNLKHGTINLMEPGARATKKRKPIVPIYPEIRGNIERLMERDSEWLFGGPEVDFYRPFVELGHLTLQIIDIRPHMLRHSRASHMLMDGDDVYKVARLLGDTVATVERVYAHAMPEFLMTESGVGG